MRRQTKKKTLPCHKIKPSTALSLFLLGVFLISGKALVSSESISVPNLSYPYSHQLFRIQVPPQILSGVGVDLKSSVPFRSSSETETGVEGESIRTRSAGSAGESIEPVQNSDLIDAGSPLNEDMITQIQNSPFYHGGGVGSDGGRQVRQNPSFSSTHEIPRWQRQLLPMGPLLMRQFLQPSTATKTFNQANGMLVGGISSTEPERNTRGLLNTFNEYGGSSQPSKQMDPRSRLSQQQQKQLILDMGLAGGQVSSKRNSITGREGYMCHFKLCQLGASGKRRWSPLFEYD